MSSSEQQQQRGKGRGRGRGKSRPAAPKHEQPEDENLCPVCTEPIKCTAFGECNHHLCHLCNLRLRSLYKSTLCALCKTDLKSVVYSKQVKDERQFKDYDLSSMMSDDKLQIYCDSQETLDEVLILLRFNCPDTSCSEALEGWYNLKQHVKRVHHRVMCDICIKHKKIFTHEHALFTRDTLTRHCRKGDPDDPSFKGHPECEFCQQFFYSFDELFEHCREKHETCHLCQRRGVHNQYYKNYNELERHFRDDHYMCQDPECLEKKFIVFDNDIDYKAHLAEAHGSRTRRVELDFDFADREQQRRQQQQQQPSGSQSSQQRQTRGNNSRSRFTVPSNFGAQLSTQPELTSDQRSQLAALRAQAQNQQGHQDSSRAASSRPHAREDWPEMRAEVHTSAPRPKVSGVTAVFQDIQDPKLSSLLTDPLRARDRELTPTLLKILDHDARDWSLLRANCLNYFRGFILPEKLFDLFETRMGLTTKTIEVFSKLIRLFPDGKQNGLLRVMNDKKVRLAAEQAEGIRVVRPWTQQQESNGSRVLGIKSSSRGNAGHFHLPSSAVPLSNSAPRTSAPVSVKRSEDFPELSGVSSSASGTTSNKGKKAKQVLLTTSLKANLAPAVPDLTPLSLESARQNSFAALRSPPASTSSGSLNGLGTNTAPRVVPVNARLSTSSAALGKQHFPGLATKPKSELAPWMSRGITSSSSSQQDNDWEKKPHSGDDQQADTNVPTGKKQQKKRVVLRFG